jgi:capsid portal protein
MKVNYTAKSYAPENVRKRYVRLAENGEFMFCEVGDDRRYDLRQGIVDRSEIPEIVAREAERISGTFPNYVEWPA